MSGAGHVTFPGDSELATLMRGKDWAATSLGPVDTWPQNLRAAVGIVLTSRFSMWMGWGDDLAFLYNDAYRTDTLGLKHPRVLGMPAREVWHEIWPEVGPRVATVMREGRATWDEGLRLILERSGYREETYHTFSYSPLHDDDGTIRGLLCVVIEETARMISERRVASLGKLAAELAGANTEAGVFAGLERSVTAAAADLPFSLTYLFDDDGTTATRVSSSGFRGEHPGAPPVIAIGPGAPWAVAELVESSQPIEVPLAADGWPTGPWEIAPASALVVPLARQGQARPAGVFIAAINPHRRFDATYREFLLLFAGQLSAGLANARAYAEERRRAESLAELDRAKTAFFSNVSHEFRTPLTLMLGPLGGLLADPDVPPALGAELATIHRNALRLLKLVNTMLDFSRIEAGRATAQFRAVDLTQLTADLASVFRAATEKAGLHLVVDCAPLGTLVAVDRDMWEKIVLNLVSNAFKFTLEGEIRVRLTRRGDRAVLAVQDSGAGIPPAELPRVFDRFHRVAGTKGRTHEGTGIGLALVQELVRLHDGTVEVTSELGRGTTFTVEIPIGGRVESDPETAAADEPAAARPNAYVEEALRWLPDRPTPTTPPPATARERLLVADDNADMRDYLRRLLGNRWDVQTVANGREALAAIRAQRPALVIADVMMPELDGFGLVAALRADADLRDIPLMMLSARAGEEARIEGLQAGANDYLVKPFAARDLIAHVETQLLRAAMRSAEQEHARRITQIFEQAPVAIAILRGPDHVFEIANSMYRRLVGGRQLVGLPVAEALPEIQAQGFVDLLDGVYRTGEPFVGSSVAVELHRGDGGAPEQGFVDFIYQPMVDAAGTVTGIAVIAHEVTELAVARRDAETANRAKDEFLAMLGHELRNPLAPITTALQLMRLRANLGAERELAVIERQVRHLVGLVDDLLDVSRITRGKVELKVAAVELADVIARAVEVASPLLEERRHELLLDVPRGVFVLGDAARLGQVVSNLLTNAGKYTPNGGKIAVRARRDGGHAIVTVTDTGIGIEPAMLRHIFEPFAQDRQALDRSQGGLGLGLAIVDNLIKLHGGTVAARSAGRGLGSELTVTLPVLEQPDGVTPTARPAVHAQPGAGRILIVDDNVDAAELLLELLSSHGYEVAMAHDGPSALEVAAQFGPQVGILDLGLPVMDGFELARHLQAKPGLDGIQLVAVTGYGQPSDRSKTAAAGFAAHLVKPVDADGLRAMIEQLLRGAAAPR